MEHNKSEDQAIPQAMRHQRAEALSALAAGVAHRLNNILSGVLGGAFMVKQKLDESSEAFKNAELIEVAATEASTLAEQLLTFTRQTEEPDTLIDIHGLLDDAVFFFKHTLDRRVLITPSYCESRPVVQGEPRQLLQALLNLGFLAGKAIETSGNLKILTRELATADDNDTQSTRHQIVVDISHSGNPVDDSLREKVFAGNAETDKVDAATLMQYTTTREIIERHNGTVTLSEDGRAFTLTLPIQKRRSRRDKTNKVQLDQGDGTILVVDDEASMRKLLHRFLSSLGYDVLTAADGEQAVSIYQSNLGAVDLVILDLSMPVMDGPTCFNALKNIDPQVQVIVTSGYRNDQRLSELVEGGAKGIAEKPFVPSDIAALIAKVLAGGQ